MSTTRPDSPGWVATGATLEPDGSKKSAGFAAGDVPPAKAFNWFWALASTWFTWLTERFADGGTSSDLAIKAPDGESGDASMTGGSSASGTDQDGGDAIVSGGATTGSAGSKAALHAATAGGSGTTARTPEAYLEADGDNERVNVVKSLWLTNQSAQHIWLHPFLYGAGDGVRFEVGSRVHLRLSSGSDEHWLPVVVPHLATLTNVRIRWGSVGAQLNWTFVSYDPEADTYTDINSGNVTDSSGSRVDDINVTDTQLADGLMYYLKLESDSGNANPLNVHGVRYDYNDGHESVLRPN